MINLFENINQLKDAYLMFPAFNNAFVQLKDNLELFRRTGYAQNLLILGETGTGKTTLAQVFGQQYPEYELPDRTIKPILYVAIPPTSTIAATVEAILAQLGDPAPSLGTISVKTARAVILVRACKVEMLLIDEAQHIQDRGRSQTQYFVGDWLKAFMDAIKIPVCLLGLPRTKALLQVNEQLRRRFNRQIPLLVHSMATQINESECLEIFSSLLNALPISLSPKPFGWSELGLRLHFATDSRIAYVKQILVGAVELLHQTSDVELRPHHLEQIFTERIWNAGVNGLNPFNAAFQFRPLTQPGEPFHQDDFVRNLKTAGGGR